MLQLSTVSLYEKFIPDINSPIQDPNNQPRLVKHQKAPFRGLKRTLSSEETDFDKVVGYLDDVIQRADTNDLIQDVKTANQICSSIIRLQNTYAKERQSSKVHKLYSVYQKAHTIALKKKSEAHKKQRSAGLETQMAQVAKESSDNLDTLLQDLPEEQRALVGFLRSFMQR